MGRAGGLIEPEKTSFGQCRRPEATVGRFAGHRGMESRMMKMQTVAMLTVAAIVMAARNAPAEDNLSQPVLIQPSAYTYYAQDPANDEASPSDVTDSGKSDSKPGHSISPTAFNLSGCDSDGCDSDGCDSDGCDSCGCASSCGSCCNSCNLGEQWQLHNQTCCGIHFGGWTQIGYHEAPTNRSRARGDLGAFNDVPDNLELHSQWFYAEKEAKANSCCWNWGFRADLMYGTDAQKTQGFGGADWDNDWDHGVYGWAAPQLYATVANQDWKFTIGKFFTLVGYEVVTAPGNFFFSHSLTMFNSEPFTHTGVLAERAINNNTTVYLGWTQGWDTGFESYNDSSSWLGGFSRTFLCDTVTFTYISTAGNFGMRGDDGYSHSMVVDVTLTDNMNYVLQSDSLRVTNLDGVKEDDNGINQYLFYTVNDCLKLGTRFEWWRDEGTSNYEATWGANIWPSANLVIRPEIRVDWVPEEDYDESQFAVDAIFLF